MRTPWLLCLGLALAGCSTTPARPVMLDVAAAEARSQAAQEAAQLAPITHAEAEKLRKEADAAQAAGDPTSAQILAEQAIATFARAFAQARTARSARSSDELQQPLGDASAELAKLKEEQQQVVAELQELELRIKVLREAAPVVSSGPARSGEREAARREAAQALHTEARLLCLSTRLLAPETEALKEAEAALTTLAADLDDRKKAAPIDDAMRARARCLDALTSARRASAAGSATGDALLASLGRASFAPAREDRGVVVTLRGAFSGDAVTREASEQLESLGRVAAANPSLPVVVVLHEAEPPRAEAQKRAARRAEAVKLLLARHRKEKIEVHLAGATRPVVDPSSKKDRARNERIEVVFVDAGG
jgi:outer membrane protein OmpA-like peptidoglycan-associated protein